MRANPFEPRWLPCGCVCVCVSACVRTGVCVHGGRTASIIFLTCDPENESICAMLRPKRVC